MLQEAARGCKNVARTLQEPARRCNILAAFILFYFTCADTLMSTFIRGVAWQNLLFSNVNRDFS